MSSKARQAKIEALKARTFSARTQTQASSIIAKALFGREERVFDVDSKGRKVRKFTRDNPCSADDVRELLVNVRYVSETEALEVIGKGAFDYMVKSGDLRRASESREGHWVTRQWAQKYNLPAYLGASTFIQ